MVNNPDTVFDELQCLLRAAASKLYSSPDAPVFLDWIAKAGPLLAPELNAQINPATGSTALFFRAFGVHIYNNTPLADYDFALRPLPKPERNQPCPCGSGRKYKQCCYATDQHALPLDNFNLLRYVLDCAPKKTFGTLPKSEVNAEALADVADQWLHEGNAERAMALLEPWFKPDVILKHRHRPLFDVLMDIYLHLDKPLKRKRLLERACNAEDKQLRADAWQRKATMEMDAGNPKAAWKSFTTAQQLDPDSPSLALLEMTLLCVTGESEQAKARAVFWLARFRRDRNISPDFLEMLAQCAKDPVSALFQASSEAPEMLPGLSTLMELFNAAPTPSVQYDLQVVDNEAMLQPDKPLIKLEQRWAECAEPNKPLMTHTQNLDMSFWSRIDEWLPLLQSQPLLWNSFDVLDDLVMGVDTLLQEDMFLGVDLPRFLDALLDRASTLLDCQLAQAPNGTAMTLPWLMQENRPALRMLAHKAFWLEHREGASAQFIEQAERMIRLNPNDNHGFREELATAYLVNRQPGKAIALLERYPGDALCGSALNLVLALFMENRQQEAAEHLAKIASRLKVAIDMLLAKAPREPAWSEHGISIGGKDEAWLYRGATLHLWKASGALTWLRQMVKTLR